MFKKENVKEKEGGGSNAAIAIVDKQTVTVSVRDVPRTSICQHALRWGLRDKQKPKEEAIELVVHGTPIKIKPSSN